MIHCLEYSRSEKIVWIIEELVVEYETNVYSRDPKMHRAPTELKKVHPSGKGHPLEGHPYKFSFTDYTGHLEGLDWPVIAKLCVVSFGGNILWVGFYLQRKTKMQQVGFTTHSLRTFPALTRISCMRDSSAYLGLKTANSASVFHRHL